MAITFDEFKEFYSALTADQQFELCMICQKSLTEKLFDELNVYGAKKLTAQGLYRCNLENAAKEYPDVMFTGYQVAVFQNGQRIETVHTTCPPPDYPSQEEPAE